MRTTWVAFLCLASVGCVWGYPEYRSGPYGPAQPPPVTLGAVVRLGKAGVSDDVIIETVQAEGIAWHPTSDELVALKKEGLSDRVIEAVAQAPVRPLPAAAADAWPVYPESYVVDPWWPWWCAWWWGWGWPRHGYYLHGGHGGWRH